MKFEYESVLLSRDETIEDLQVKLREQDERLQGHRSKFERDLSSIFDELESVKLTCEQITSEKNLS